jgi:hypothetical protein
VLPAARANPVTSRAASKASFFLTGIAINGVNFMTGTKITEKSNNACYEMLGEAGTPNSITAVAIFDADGVPASAAATVKLVTPFQTVTGSGRFSKVIFLAKHLWRSRARGQLLPLRKHAGRIDRDRRREVRRQRDGDLQRPQAERARLVGHRLLTPDSR